MSIFTYDRHMAVKKSFFDSSVKTTGLFLLILVLPLILSVTFMQQIYNQRAATPGIPQFSHVFVIMYENHSYSQIIGNSAAPYINQIANQYGLATNFLAISHPSLPNYLAFSGGSTFGVTSDCNTCFQNTTANIFSELEAAGKTWKSYHESMPSNCFLNDSGSYVLHHNPAAYYLPLRSSCAKNDVPYSQFASDLASGKVGNFNFIVPNNSNNMHSGTIQAGDAWLQNELPKILSSSAYQNNGLVIFTFDEGDKQITPNQIVTVVMSPLAKTQFKSNVSYTLYSLLRTIADALGVIPPSQAASAAPMTDFFGGSSGTTGTPTPTQIISQGPTPTFPPNTTVFHVTLCPHGLGNCGDNVNAAGGNTSPQHTSRNVTVTVLNANNQPVGTGQGTITYSNASQNFQGTVSAGTIPSGQYLISINIDGFLPKQIPGIITVTQTTTLPSLSLVAGDINNDRQIDIGDYNLLIGCFGSKQNTSSCTQPPSLQSPGADINDDGKIDGIDYNLFLRELSVQKGG